MYHFKIWAFYDYLHLPMYCIFPSKNSVPAVIGQNSRGVCDEDIEFCQLVFLQWTFFTAPMESTQVHLKENSTGFIFST